MAGIMPYPRTSEQLNSAGEILYLNERYSDVAILVENGNSVHRYPAHSLFLRCVSEVIGSMLDADMSEKSSKTITVVDSTTVAIKQFLRFIYIGDVVITEWRETVELLSLAHRYQVAPLVTTCEKLLLESITLSSVCFLHDIAQLYTLSDLQFQTEKFILDGGFIVIATEGFGALCKKTVENIISCRFLNVENELSVLNALRQWATLECSRRRQMLSKENVLAAMRPMLHGVRLNSIPPDKVQFIPSSVINHHTNTVNDVARVKFFVSPTLHNHMASLKFVVELGAFINKQNNIDHLTFLKFSSDTHLFIMGFRIVGMFQNSFSFSNSNPMLILGKQNKRSRTVQFDLSSVPWKEGAMVGEYVWKEVVAYFPQPARVDSFTTYALTVKYRNLTAAKWPRTRLETNHVSTEIGPIVVYTFGQCSGVTELFTLPAPPLIGVCNDK